MLWIFIDGQEEELGKIDTNTTIQSVHHCEKKIKAICNKEVNIRLDYMVKRKTRELFDILFRLKEINTIFRY